MAKKFTFKNDERKKSHGWRDEDGNPVEDYDGKVPEYTETEEEHAARVKENAIRRSRGEFTQDEMDEINAAAEELSKRDEYLEGSYAARERLGLLTKEEKQEAKYKKQEELREQRQKANEDSAARVAAMREHERERRDDWHRANMEARDRRLDARDQIAMRDTGRYSRWDREAAKDWLSRNDRNNNLDEDRKNALEIQREKTKGMVGQGSEAAKANAQAAIEASRNQWGYFDKDGKFIGGGEVVKNANENAAKERLEKMGIEGKAKAQEAQNKNNLDVVTQQGKNATALEQERANTETAKLKTIEAQKAMAADRKMEELRLRGFQKMDIEKYKSMYKGMDEDREGGGVQNPMKKALTDEEMIKKWGGTPEGKLMLKERFGIDVDKATGISQYETT